MFIGKEKDVDFEVDDGILASFSWRVNGKEINEKKGICFIGKQKIISFDLLTDLQKEIYNKAIDYLEQGDREKALTLLVKLEDTFNHS